MKEISISANDAGQRLDRFLKKYLANAPLSAIYKLIRKDVKVDGRRRREDYSLSEGEVLQIFLQVAKKKTAFFFLKCRKDLNMQKSLGKGSLFEGCRLRRREDIIF